jgi:hypothetical protein
MSDKEIDKFNVLMSEFIDKMVNQFNDSDRLKNYRKAFLMFKVTSPKVPVNLFMAGTVNYKEHIKKRDENFFLTDVSIDNLSKQLGNFTNDIGLAYHWNSITQKTKTAIWDYIQSLYVLGEIIVNKNKDLFDRYNVLYVSDYKQEINTIQNGIFSDDFLRKLNS